MATTKNKRTSKRNTINQAKPTTKSKMNLNLVWSMLFFGMAVVGFLGMLHPLDLEPFDTFNDCMKLLLGRWHILLPFIFLLISIRKLFGIKLVRLNTSFVSFIIMTFCGPALFHALRFPDNFDISTNILTHGGGMWGGLLAILLQKALGFYATIAVLGCGCLVAIGILIPWGEWLSSSKRDEEYEEFLKETEKINSENKKKEHPSFRATNSKEPKAEANTIKSAEVLITAPKEQPRQNVYQDDEFSAFTDGIKKENTFRKIINYGKDIVKADSKPKYQHEEEKEIIEIPEWEEKREVVLRPAINYGDTTTQMPQQRFMDPNSVAYAEPDHEEEASLPKSESTVVKDEPKDNPKPYESIIHNPYRKMQQDMQITDVPKEAEQLDQAVASTDVLPKVEAETEPIKNDSKPAEPAITNATKTASAEAEEEKNTIPTNPGFVIHRGKNDEAQDTVKAINETARSEAQLEQEESSPKKKYIFPSYNLLTAPLKKNTEAGDAEIMQQCKILEQTLADFKVRANVIAATRGPAVTQFELMPAPGVKVNTVVNLSDDIALRLAARGVRMEAPIPGKSAIGVEVPNLNTDPVFFREVVDSDVVRGKESKLCIGLGKDISGNIITADIAKMPHLLIAGSTGSGKSVCINTIICGILYKALPEEVKLILVDPKVVELSIYDDIPHLLTPVVTDPKKAASALHWAVAEMERRYQLFADNHVRNMDGYNKDAKEKLPYIVIIIDEMADLMATVKADIETAIMRLAAKARAAGIHMILATQRPSVDVITGVLKNNIPSRIAFMVSSLIDSRTILDSAGAEKLLGKGDMLYAPSGSPKPTRVQGAFVSDEEVEKIVESIKAQELPLEYSEEVTAVELESDKDKKAAVEDSNEDAAPSPADDPLFEKALMLVLDTGQASASMMQRRFSIGYNRAARLVDTMAELGVVGKAMGSKPREVIMDRAEAEARFLNNE